jgi:ankyrin repeat protein
MNLNGFPLHSAARDGNLTQVESLLNASTDVSRLLASTDDDARTAFHWAASANCPDICALFLTRCGDDDALRTTLISAADESGATPLISAVSVGSASCLRVILQAAAQISSPAALAAAALVNAATGDLRNTPLHYAASKGRDEIIVILLENGAKINAFNKYGQTPLLRAVSAGQRRTALLLLDHGASAVRCDSQGNNVLHVAALAVDRPMLVALLRRRDELGVALDDRNGDEKALADLVGGADLLAKLIAEADKPEAS